MIRTTLISFATATLLVVAGCKSSNPHSPDTHAGEAHACGGHEGAAAAASDVEKPPVAFDASPAIGTMATCPVSGESFAVTETTPRAEHDGRHYAFCCGGCQMRFESNPGEFAVEE